MASSVSQQASFPYSKDVMYCIFQILLACGLNVFVLEMMVTRDRMAGGLVTLAQFAFVSLLGLRDVLETSQFYMLPRLKKRNIPFLLHVGITTIFFVNSGLNNLALGYGISMPMHMIFRSSSLAASLLVGAIFLKRRYLTGQLIGVALVLVGICLASYADGIYRGATCSGCDSSNLDLGIEIDEIEYRNNAWVKLVGISMLTCSLFLSAGLGFCQEYVCKRWDNSASELRFYSHALALPYFAILYRDQLNERIAFWNQTETLGSIISESGWGDYFLVPEIFLKVPCLWVLLLANVLTQLFCISKVYKLTTISSSLTVTLAITFRKFLSIIVSVFYFRNPFSILHAVGLILTFGGVGVYISTPDTSSIKVKKHKE